MCNWSGSQMKKKIIIIERFWILETQLFTVDLELSSECGHKYCKLYDF